MSADIPAPKADSAEPIPLVARIFERDLRKKLGLTRREAKAFMAGGWQGILRSRDPAEASRQEGQQVVEILSDLIKRMQENV